MAGRSDPSHAPADQADILMPDEDITITDPQSGAAREITVREYRFRQMLKAQTIARALIEDMARVAGDPERLTSAALFAVLGEHDEAWIALCALATGLEADVIEELREADSTALSLAVWRANSNFFLGRILGEQLSREALATSSASSISSTGSQRPATDRPT